MATFFNRLKTANLLTAAFFLIYFWYFSVLNGYHLMYFEQDQLFRFNWNYLWEFFQKPGGLIGIANAFLVQFFVSPWVSAIEVAFIAFIIYYLTRLILKFHNLNGWIFPILLVFILAMTLNGHKFGFVLFTGIMFSLLAFRGFIVIPGDKIRNFAGLSLVAPLFFLMGVFALLLVIMIAISEVTYRKYKLRFLTGASYIVLTLLFLFLSKEYVFYVTFRDLLFSPINSGINTEVMIISLSVLLIIPLFLLLSSFCRKIEFKWNPKYIVSGILIFSIIVIVLWKYSYDPRYNKLQEIDYQVQHENWNEVLRLSKEYPGNNQLVMYYANLALYKTGRIGDELFHYPQAGTTGLWLEWKRNEINQYHGGEIFYHLGFSNEAFRWAFEAMEAKGLNPRSLKRLAITSIINRHNDLARKYLRYLSQTLYYNDFAEHYLKCLNDSGLLKSEKEIMNLQKYTPQKDFIAFMNPIDIGFYPLLDNHPDNRMAFEYMMASFLLHKNLTGFASNIHRLSQLGYTRIPVHFEEAIIIYSGVTKKNILPEGYALSTTTRERFSKYAAILNEYRNDQFLAASVLSQEFGNTFWFYMQFNHPEK